MKAPEITSPQRSSGPSFTRCSPAAEYTQGDVGNHRAGGEHDCHHGKQPHPVEASREESRETMGDEPRMSSKAVRTEVLCLWMWSGGAASVSGPISCAVSAA
jgi:hypothetical protein